MEEQAAIIENKEVLGATNGGDSQIEQRARIQGWVPKEEFRGDQRNWRPADEFVKRADEMMPILKSVNKKLETNVTELTKKLTETQGMVEKMIKIQAKYSDDMYETKISDIRSMKRKAAEEGDVAAYDRLEQHEKNIKPPEKIDLVAEKQSDNHMNSEVHPDVSRWMVENASWWGVDKDLTDYAMYIGDQMKTGQHALAVPGNEYAFCQEVKKRLQAMFPTKFKNPNKGRSDIDESDTRGGDSQQSGKNKTWNDLPKDAKEHCSKLTREIPGYTKEKYLKDYFEEG